MAQTARMKVRAISRYLQVPLIYRWAQMEDMKALRKYMQMYWS